MREGEAAGKGRVSTRILYDMFQMNFPSTSKGEINILISNVVFASYSNKLLVIIYF